MKKNYLHVVLWLVLLVVIALLAMNRMPQLSLFGNKLKEVDILADLKGVGSVADTEDAMLADMIDRRADSIIAAKMAARDTTRLEAVKGAGGRGDAVEGSRVTATPTDTVHLAGGTGNALIEDFSMGEAGGMAPYYAALNRMSGGGGVVRIAVLGDSYIEGDILTADLRMMLQQQYGGCGVGYVPVTSETFGFRRSVKHSFSGWRSYKVTGPDFDRSRETISGEYAIPDSAATVELRGQRKYYSRLDSCDESSIYFRADAPCTVTASVNGGQFRQQFDVSPGKSIQKLTIDAQGDRMGRVRWSVNRTGGGYTFYGVTMDCRRGVILDCYSMRSTSGPNLLGVPEGNMREYDSLRHYDLIVLMYGLNAITPEIINYEGYKERMCDVIERIKRDCPGSGILVVSVGDRCERRDGAMRTMRGVLAMVKYQRLIAAESGVAFWSMFDAMGGEGSIVRMVEGKPREANGDYTHINFLGGRRLAGYFYDALLKGKEDYDNNNAQ